MSGRDRAVPDQRPQFGERDGNVLLSIAVVISVGDQCAGLADPRRLLGPRQPGGCRSCSSSPRCASARRSSSRTCRRSLGLALFIVANFAYQAALIYYDATLKTVSYPATRGKLSGIGTAIGYCGTVFVGLLIFFLDVPVADRFRLTAILFLVFAIPIFLVRPRAAAWPARRPVTAADIRDAFGQLRRSIAHAREVPGLGRFLLGRFFYSDAVNTVIVVMSVVTMKTSGCRDRDAVLVLLSLTLVAIAMSFVWGWLCDRQGPKRTLVWVLLSWAVGLAHRRVRDRVRAGRAGPVPRRRRDPRAAALAASRWRTGC